MAKQRSVVSVHLDIAALTWATRNIKTDAEWAIWGQTFVEALATRNYDLNTFAASLAQEVIDFRVSEAERIKETRHKSSENPNHVHNVLVHPVQSVHAPVPTVSKSDSKSDRDQDSREDQEPPFAQAQGARTNTPKGVRPRKISEAFKKPEYQEIVEFCKSRGDKVDPQAWFHHYESNGWRVGRNPMKSWKSAVVTWEKNPMNKIERKFR